MPAKTLFHIHTALASPWTFCLTFLNILHFWTFCLTFSSIKREKEGASKGNLIGYYIIAFLSQNENEWLIPEIRLLTNALSHLLAQQWHHCWWITTNLHFLKIRLSVKKRAVTQFHNCRIWQKCIVQNRFIIAIPLIRNQQMFRIAEFTCFPHKIESDFARTGQTTLNWNSSLLENIMNRTYPSAFLLVHWELLLLHRLQLVPEVELGSLVEKIRWSSLSKDYCKPSSAAWRTCSRTWKPFSVSAWCCNCEVVI